MQPGFVSDDLSVVIVDLRTTRICHAGRIASQALSQLKRRDMHSLKDRTRVWATCALLSLGAAADAATTSVPDQSRLTCESESPGGDYREFTCQTHPTGTTKRFRFRANFSGGHDDTMASMTPTLDTMPLTCEPGSKTRLMGEDGDVSLECRFSLPQQTEGDHILRVVVRWSHAQYTGFEFGASD